MGMEPLPPSHGKRSVENWASTYISWATESYEPTSVEEVISIVQHAAVVKKVVRAVGSLHSPNDIAMVNDGIVVSLSKLNRILEISKTSWLCSTDWDVSEQRALLEPASRPRYFAKVEGGITLERLNEELASRGLALYSLGSISEQSISGAISTGTHGTGHMFGALSQCVVEIQLVTGTGEVVILSQEKDPDAFRAALCGLGCLGIITGLVLCVVPAYDIYIERSTSKLDLVLQNYVDRATSAPFYRFWWFPHTDFVTEWRGKIVEPEIFRNGPKIFNFANIVRFDLTRVCEMYRWLKDIVLGFHIYQFLLFFGLIYPPFLTIVNKFMYYTSFHSAQTDIGRSDHILNFDCLFKQHVNEWCVPLDALPKAFQLLRTYVRTQNQFVHFPVEVRFASGDDALLSPSNNSPCVWIGIIMYKPYGIDPPYKQYFYQFEKDMEKIGGRPHWAKDFHWTGASGQFAKAYQHWDKFLVIRDKFDPKRVFENEWSKRVFGTRGANSANAGPNTKKIRKAGSPNSFINIRSGYLADHPAENLTYVDSCLKLKSIPLVDDPPTFSE